MCINQKELKQNKISEMDGVYHHSKCSERKLCLLVPSHLDLDHLSEDGRKP